MRRMSGACSGGRGRCSAYRSGRTCFTLLMGELWEPASASALPAPIGFSLYCWEHHQHAQCDQGAYRKTSDEIR